MGSLFSSPKLDSPPPPPSPPTKEDTAVQDALKAEKELRLKQKSRASTILTSTSGLADEATTKKTLLGQ